MVDDSPEFDQVRRFWQNPQIDRALICHDVESSLAQADMLGQAGVISSEATSKLKQALGQIRQEVAQGRLFNCPDDMDVYGGLERRLEELAGEAAIPLKAARCRQDQMATNIRLWLREAVFDVFADLLGIRQELLHLAVRDQEVIMPGYTHMQPAMPILISHWWLANEERFARDFDRLIDFYRRFNTLPLGAGEFSGGSQPANRQLIAEQLAFDAVITNSLDAVSDRDYLVEFGAFAALSGTHISQMSSEVMLWTTQEFGFARLKKDFSFRSFNLPSKRNSALLEILRCRPAIIDGKLSEFLTVLKGIPLSYSQDLQECVPSLMNLVEELKFILELGRFMLPAIELDIVRMQEMVAADLPNVSNAWDFLVTRGLPPDKVATIIEGLTNYCKQRHKYLSDLSLNEWQQFSPAFDMDIFQSVTSEQSAGGNVGLLATTAVQQSQDRLKRDQERLPVRAVERLKVRELENI